MAIAYVNGASGAFPGDSQTTITTPATSLTAGNRLVVLVRWSTGGGSISSVTDTAGNTYSLVRTQAGLSSSLAMYEVNNCLGHGSNVVTVTFNVSVAFRSMCAAQYSGSSGYSLSVHASSHVNTGALAPAVGVPAADALVVLGVQVDDAAGDWTAGSGMTERVADAVNVCMLSDAILTTSTSLEPTAANTSAQPKISVIGVFTPVATGGGGGLRFPKGMSGGLV